LRKSVTAARQPQRLPEVASLVPEQLAAIGRVEEFFDAVDSDDVQRAALLMRKAKIDASS